MPPEPRIALRGARRDLIDTLLSPSAHGHEVKESDGEESRPHEQEREIARQCVFSTRYRDHSDGSHISRRGR